MALPGPDLLIQAREASEATVFLETGTHRGDGVALALEAGFEDCFSVEVSPFAYGWSCHRFAGQPGVHLRHGDSRDFLRELLPPRGGIFGPCVIWLDAHWCGGDGEIADNNRLPPPLLDELAILAEHRCKTHAILIDDVRNFGTELPCREEVEAAVLAINPEYSITYVDGREFSSDILMAVVP